MNDIVTTRPGQFDLSPQTFEQAMKFSEMLADSDLVPKDFRGKPGNCMIAMQWGAEVGLKAMQALQNIAVINGRPALWGDSVIALVRGSPLCESVIETDDGTKATCRVKRRGEPEQERSFSMDDAKLAGLLGKQGPWSQYPKRMRQMRARAFALRDVFPDVLKGLPVAEEMMDLPDRNMGPADIVQPAAPATYPDDKFAENLPKWREVIGAGRKTAGQIVAMAQSKHPLTAAQVAAIREPIVKQEPAAAETPPTFAQIFERLNAAKTEDDLHRVADLINAVTDDTQQRELNAAFDERVAELQN